MVMDGDAPPPGFVQDLDSALIHALPPDWEAERDDETNRLVLTSTADQTVACELDHLHRQYRLAEQKGRDGLHAAVGEVLALIRRIRSTPAELTPADLDRVYPYLVTTDQSEGTDSDLLVQPWMSSLSVGCGIAVAGDLVCLTQRQVAPLEVSAEQLHERALANLTKLDVHPRRVSRGVVGFAGGDYAFHAQILLREKVAEMAMLVGIRALFVALPSTRLVLACRSFPTRRRAMEMTARVLHHLDEDPLVPDVLVWSLGDWLDMD